MFDLNKLNSASDDELMEFCVRRGGFLRHGEHSGVKGKIYVQSLFFLRMLLSAKVKRVSEVLYSFKGK